jgi:hypothetical protein
MWLYLSASLQNIPVYDQAQKILSERGEVYFCFDYPGAGAKKVLKNISVDRIEHGRVFAYANKPEFDNLYSVVSDIEILISPSLMYPPRMAETLKDVQAWDYYPTYGQYTAMMDSFAAAHPDLCRKEIIGSTVNGRELIILKISDNVNVKEAEPEFLYTSSMHGDELTGAILMLRLIDYLLNGYGTDPEVTELLDHTEIWINPLANPDGTYLLGNNTVAGAIRYNGNFVDLNRNFPDPEDGPHPDGNNWQPETVAWMQFMSQHNFVMSANFHGGAELMNYPWDTYTRLHPDDEWLQMVSREYADTVQFFGPAGYFDDENNGITNGNAWYEIDGGRQDYANYFHHCREICIEISASKKPQATALPGFWDANYRALINYMKQTYYGIHGIVTDSITGEPLRAFVEALGHDADSSQIYSDSTHGNYHRLIKAGTYELRFSSPGYYSKTITGITASDYDKTELDVQLAKNTQSVANKQLTYPCLYPNPASEWVYVKYPGNDCPVVQVSDISGRLVNAISSCENGVPTIYVGVLNPGWYLLLVQGEDTYRIPFLVD